MKKFTFKSINQNRIILLFALTLLFTFELHAQKPILTFYGKLGYLLTPPNTADLGYSVDGVAGGLDDLQDVNQTTYGFGFKVFSANKNNRAFGGDIGTQKLFLSKIEYETSSTVYTDYQTDREWELYINGLIRFKKAEKPFFFEAGPGLHVVFWDWESYYSSTYQSTSDSDGGTELNFGIVAEAGLKIETSKAISIPISVRSDMIFRYGVLWQISATVGIEF